jgi:hypothetical protein
MNDERRRADPEQRCGHAASEVSTGKVIRSEDEIMM